MIKSSRIAVFVLVGLFCAGCASSGSGGTEIGDAEIVKLRPDADEVPQEVRAIELQIDQKSALRAEEIEIYVSKNYEWDVALTGDSVGGQRPDGDGGLVSVATGNPRASFRNMDIRAWKQITFRRSGLDVVPFIRIVAKGRAAHASEAAGQPVIRRAPVIKIENANIEFVEAPGLDRPVVPVAANGVR